MTSIKFIFPFLVCVLWIDFLSAQESDPLERTEGTWLGVSSNGDSLFIQLEFFEEYDELFKRDIRYVTGKVIEINNSPVFQKTEEGFSLRRGYLMNDQVGNEAIVFMYKELTKVEAGYLALYITADDENTLRWSLVNKELTISNFQDSSFELPREMTLTRMY